MALLKTETFTGTFGSTDRWSYVCEHSRPIYITLPHGSAFSVGEHPCSCLEFDAFILQARKEALEKAMVNRKAKNDFLDRSLLVGRRNREDEHEKDPPTVKHYRKLHDLERAFWVPCDGEHYLMFLSLAPGGFELIVIDLLEPDRELELKKSYIPTLEGRDATHTALKAALPSPDKDFVMVVEAARELFRFQSDRNREQRLLTHRMKHKVGGGLDTGQL